MIYESKWVKLTPEGQRYLEEKMQKANQNIGLSDKEQDENAVFVRALGFPRIFPATFSHSKTELVGPLDISY